MAIPFIVGAAVAAAAAYGGKKAYDGYQTKDEAETIANKADKFYRDTKEMFDKHNENVSVALDVLGQFELKIGSEMNEFQIIAQELLEKISISKNSEIKVSLPQHRLNKVADLSLSATTYLAGLAGGAAIGAAASFALYNGVIALAAASTGVKISALYGAAAYNATMAAIGGGAVAAGGWGMAAAPWVLGGAVVAPVLAIAGWLYNDHAEKALEDAKKYKKEVNEAVGKMNIAMPHLDSTTQLVKRVTDELERIYILFSEYFEQLKSINTLIKSNSLSLDMMSDNLMLIIENGYQLSAIMTDIITTPLFKIKKSPDGQVIVEAKKDENDKDVYIPVIEIDKDGVQIINSTEINAALAKGSDEEIQKVLIK